MENTADIKNVIGCCGLNCGLCSKYVSESKSRCLGCRKGEQHSWCSIWNCCVKKRGLFFFTDCPDVFVCEIFRRRNISEDTDWKPACRNLRKIQTDGLEALLGEEAEKIRGIRKLLKNFNDGRSMSFFCKTCSALPAGEIERIIEKTEMQLKDARVPESDKKTRAKAVRAEIEEYLSREHTGQE